MYTPHDESAFILQLRKELRAGHSLVPFIGSGCSAESGILMGSQFTDYLGYVLWRCLVPVDDAHWDIRKAGWPPFPDQAGIQSARSWALQEFKCIADECNLKVFDDELILPRFGRQHDYATRRFDLERSSNSMGLM